MPKCIIILFFFQINCQKCHQKTNKKQIFFHDVHKFLQPFSNAYDKCTREMKMDLNCWKYGFSFIAMLSVLLFVPSSFFLFCWVEAKCSCYHNEIISVQCTYIIRLSLFEQKSIHFNHFCYCICDETRMINGCFHRTYHWNVNKNDNSHIEYEKIVKCVTLLQSNRLEYFLRENRSMKHNNISLWSYFAFSYFFFSYSFENIFSFLSFLFCSAVMWPISDWCPICKRNEFFDAFNWKSFYRLNFFYSISSLVRFIFLFLFFSSKKFHSQPHHFCFIEGRKNTNKTEKNIQKEKKNPFLFLFWIILKNNGRP